MNRNWINEQTSINIAQFDKAMETSYPESKAYINDPQAHIDRICRQCNYLEAVKKINWQSYLQAGSLVMDMGCGGGWLAAYLSKFDNIKQIYALDSSIHYLFKILPEVIKILEGVNHKIDPIQGLFIPIMFPDGFLDAIVVSSALHHADNLESVLKEVRRVLKKNGLLFILNEAPFSKFGYISSITKASIKIFINTFFQRYCSVSPSISSSSYLHDPYLGDKMYPLWYWKEAIKRTNFEIIEQMDTHLPTIKQGKGPSLKHFICKAV